MYVCCTRHFQSHEWDGNCLVIVCYVFSNRNTLFSGNVLNRRTPSVVYVRIDLPVLFHNMVNKVSHFPLKGLLSYQREHNIVE